MLQLAPNSKLSPPSSVSGFKLPSGDASLVDRESRVEETRKIKREMNVKEIQDGRRRKMCAGMELNERRSESMTL
jgi:hypothetical protein